MWMASTPSSALVANWLGALAAAVNAVKRETAAELGSDSRLAALLTLNEFPQMPIVELAAVLGLTHSACVRLIDGLAADGFVSRTRAQADSRRAELTLTPIGEQTAQAAQDERLRRLEGFLSPITGEQMTQFGNLVERLLSAVAPDRSTARHLCRYCLHRICEGPDCPIGRSVEE